MVIYELLDASGLSFMFEQVVSVCMVLGNNLLYFRFFFLLMLGKLYSCKLKLGVSAGDMFPAINWENFQSQRIELLYGFGCYLVTSPDARVECRPSNLITR